MAASSFWSGAGGPLVSAGIGLLGTPFNIASQRRQQDIMRSGMEAQLRAQNAALETNAMLGREGMYGQLGESLGARVFGQTAADLDFGRQFRAKNWELGPGAEKQLAIDAERYRRPFDLNASAAAREESQRKNRTDLIRSLTERNAGMAQAFGPVAPFKIDAMFV